MNEPSSRQPAESSTAAPPEDSLRFRKTVKQWVEHRRFPLHLAGVTFDNADGTSRQKLLKRCRDGERVTLEPIPNKHDRHAVAVMSRHGQIGYVSRDDAPDICRTLQEPGSRRYAGILTRVYSFEGEDMPGLIWHADLEMIEQVQTDVDAFSMRAWLAHQCRQAGGFIAGVLRAGWKWLKIAAVVTGRGSLQAAGAVDSMLHRTAGEDMMLHWILRFVAAVALIGLAWIGLGAIF